MRGGVEFAGVSVAAVIDLAADGATCAGARIAVGAVAAAPVRARLAEQALIGRELDAALFPDVARQVSAEIRPLPHHGYSAGYLGQCLEVQARRALTQALEGAGTAPAARGQGDTP
jgi:CO/xanthine dehydrogenase FAD-binding subunit